VVPPRTHLVVRVDLVDGPWLFDVGVGGQSPTAALRWVADEVQDTPHDRRRLVRDGDRWFHQVEQGGAWVDVCAFTGEEMPEIDRTVANWYTSTHPASRFRTSLVVARATASGRLHVANRRLRERDRDGALLREVVFDDPEALRAALRAEFGLVVPDGPLPLPPDA
jgi:N-hydroxyarylamine O-acetyltransferase